MRLLRRYPLSVFFVSTLTAQVFSVWCEARGTAPPLLVRSRIYQPALIALALTYALDGAPGLRKVLASLTRVRLAWYWYAFALLYAPLLGILPQVAFKLLGLVEHIDYDPQPFEYGWLFAKLTFTIALIEEISWVSFGVKGLEKHLTPLLAGLLGGIPWGLYYVPLNEAGIQVAGAFPNFAMVINFMAISAVCGWLYYKTNSALLVALMQLEVNYASLIFPVLPRPGAMASYYVFIGLKWAFALALFHSFGPRPLFGRRALGAGALRGAVLDAG